MQYLRGTDDGVVRTAQMKLLRSEHFKEDSLNQSLAVLGQRFSLDGVSKIVGLIECLGKAHPCSWITIRPSRCGILRTSFVIHSRI